MFTYCVYITTVTFLHWIFQRPSSHLHILRALHSRTQCLPAGVLSANDPSPAHGYAPAYHSVRVGHRRLVYSHAGVRPGFSVLGMTRAYSVEIRDAIVPMRRCQETDQFRRYMGLPCPLRFHEDGW